MLIGPCRVVDARGQDELTREFLQGVELAERTLFYTGQPDEWREFPTVFMNVHPDAVAYLAEHGVRLFGTDCPSVDPLTSKDLPGHKAFARHGIHILEAQVNPSGLRARKNQGDLEAGWAVQVGPGFL